jgi:hypothetical protein
MPGVYRWAQTFSLLLMPQGRIMLYGTEHNELLKRA